MKSYAPEATLINLRTIGDPEVGLLSIDDARAYAEIVRREGFAGIAGSGDPELVSICDWMGDLTKVRKRYGLQPEPGQPSLSDLVTIVRQPLETWVKGAVLPRPTDDEFEALKRASAIFQQFGVEIAGALLLVALPEAFAAEEGAKVLVHSGGLLQPGSLRRRIRGTAQFLMLVLAQNTQSPKSAIRDLEKARWREQTGRCWRAVVALRYYHASIRAFVKNDGTLAGTPINQEDLLGMLLGFSVGTLDVLDRFGIRLSDDDQESYLTAWNYIGKLLGIGTPAVLKELKKGLGVEPVFRTSLGFESKSLLPETVRDGRRLFEQIRARVWTETDDMDLTTLMDSTDAGRRLVTAMLVDLRASMPKFAKQLPQVVIRELVDPRVRTRLALGEGGLLELGYTQFLRLVENSPIHRTYGRGTLTGPALRIETNFVTRNSVMDFLGGDGPPFVIPGLQHWVTTLESTEIRPLGAKPAKGGGGRR